MFERLNEKRKFRKEEPVIEEPITPELKAWQDEQIEREKGHGLVSLKWLLIPISVLVAIGLLNNGINALLERHAKKAAAKAGTSRNVAAPTQAFEETKTVNFYAAAQKMGKSL